MKNWLCAQSDQPATMAEPLVLLDGALVATSSALRARLREEFVRERVALQTAIAHRLDRPEDDIYSAVTARITIGVFELAGIQARNHDADAVFDEETFTEAAQHIMKTLAADAPSLPRVGP